MAFARYAAASAVDFVSAFANAAAEFVSTIPACDMGARVPACPRWSAYDLVVHLGNVHGWAATIVETGRSTPEQDDRPSSRRSKSVARWYAGKAEDLLQVLRTADLDDECWTFSEGHSTVAFWPRRQTHETLVHLVDLEQAVGRTSDIVSSLAADGVDEVLDVFLPRMHARGRPARLSAPLRLHATDTGDTWLLTPSPSGDGPPLVHRLHAGLDVKGVGSDWAARVHTGGLGGSDPAGSDVKEHRAAWDTAGDTGGDTGGDTAGNFAGDRVDTVRAAASDLMLLLWKRRSPDHRSISLDGDRTRLLAFLRSPLTP